MTTTEAMKAFLDTFANVGICLNDRQIRVEPFFDAAGLRNVILHVSGEEIELNANDLHQLLPILNALAGVQ